MQTDFQPSENNTFWSELVETGNQEKTIFKERAHFCQNTIFFPFFSETQNNFSTKPFIPTTGNGFSGYWKPFSFVQRFFFQLEKAPEISGSNFLKKDHILTNATDFLARENHFFHFFQTFFILQLAHIFKQILHFGWWKRLFCLLETVLFYSEVFVLTVSGILLKIGEVDF